MPIVTPNWNLPTPALTDAYNLVGDLATFSSAVDGAITSVANARKGTAAQRIAAAAATPDGVLWQDTDSIKMIWKRDGSVAGQWAPAVARWIGTTAQMNAFTQAPNGFEWYNTTNSLTYIRTSGAWAVPIDVQSRRTSVPGGNSGTASGFTWGPTATITFTTPFPTGSLPVVNANVALSAFQGYISVVSNVTLTSFKVTVMRLGAAPDAVDLHWTARAN